MIRNPKILKSSMPLTFRAVWKSALFPNIVKMVTEESDCENSSSNFLSIFFCVYTYTHMPS